MAFPNPQDALPLLPRARAEKYDALARHLSRPEKTSLAEARRAVARSHGFATWRKLIAHVEALRDRTSRTYRFEKAADAIVDGRIAALRRLLRDDPKLVHARSSREHNATLLHYTSANGVENWRQRTPENIAKIAAVLLEAGAAVDAEADVYGGGATTLGLAATSVHPANAGVQKELLQTLIDHGASLDRPNAAGNGQRILAGCLANGQPQAAAFLASAGAPLDLESAAGLGRLDVVTKLMKRAPAARVRAAAKMARWYGHEDIARVLLPGD